MLKSKAALSYQLLRGQAHKLLDEKLGKKQYLWLKRYSPKMHMSDMTKPELLDLITKLKTLT